jgi:putative endonuclease
LKVFEIKNREPFSMPLGERGEMVAWAYLVNEGYRLLEKNYRCPLGEIDVVAARGGRLAFVEIKTRRHHGLGLPEEAVDAAKQKKLVRLAQYYLKEKNREDARVSFDVLSVTWRDGEEPEFRLLMDAFMVEEEIR